MPQHIRSLPLLLLFPLAGCGNVGELMVWYTAHCNRDGDEPSHA